MKSKIKKTMKALLESGRCIDNTTGEVDYTALAETTAEELGHDEWLDDSDHEIWDLALEVGDNFISSLP